jgi:predicted MPP superfamily phosphohydrolase
VKFLLLSIPVNNIRFGDPTPSYFVKFLSSLIFIWYLPKLPIFIILVIKDITRLVIFIIKKIIVRNKNSVSVAKPPSQWALAGWSLALLPFILYIYSSAVTTHDFEVKEVQVKLNDLPYNLDGLRIVQISDLHPPSFFSGTAFWEVTQIIHSLNPDMIVITGDFVNNHPDELDLIYEDMRQLKAPHGVYGCIGNHDHYMTDELHQKLITKIENAGIDLLINENITLNIKGEKLQLAGVDNSSWQLNYGDYEKTFSGISEVYPTILLCHDPVDWQNNVKGKYPADLTLSGHTHGGQIGIDIFGHELYPAVLAYTYWRGLYKEGSQYLYVNTGLGTVGPPVRIGHIKPEITLIELKRPEDVAIIHFKTSKKIL